MKRMKKKAWLNAPKFCCPVCRSTDVEGTGHFDAHNYEQFCHSCGQVFVELMETTGYKLIDRKVDRSELADVLRNNFDLIEAYKTEEEI